SLSRSLLMYRTNNLFAVVVAGLAALANIQSARATAWTNNAGGNWSVGTNWDAGTPNPGDPVRFTAFGLGQTTNMDLGNFTILDYEIFQNTTNNTHTLNLAANSLTMTNMRLAVDVAPTIYHGHLTVNGTLGSSLNIT